jgi:hypothetical protein
MKKPSPYLEPHFMSGRTQSTTELFAGNFATIDTWDT